MTLMNPQSLLGPHWQTRLSAIGGTAMAALTFLSTVSYETSPLAAIIPPEHKGVISVIAGTAAALLWLWNGIRQKDKSVTGGITPVLSPEMPDHFIDVRGVRKSIANATQDELDQIRHQLGL